MESSDLSNLSNINLLITNIEKEQLQINEQNKKNNILLETYKNMLETIIYEFHNSCKNIYNK
jgi:hypothetical protein